MPAQSSYFATYYEEATTSSPARSRPDVPSSVTRSPSVSAASHAESSSSSIKTTSSALHAVQSVQRVALHARRASATSQVLLGIGSCSGSATPLQSAGPVQHPSPSLSSAAGDDSVELNADLLRTIDWPRPPAAAPSISSSVRSPTPLTMTGAPTTQSYPFLQSDPSGSCPSPSDSRILHLPTPAHFFHPSPVDDAPELDFRWGFASPGASTTRFSGFTNKTSLSVDGWSETAAKGSTSTHAIAENGLHRSGSNDTMTTGQAVKGRDSLSSMASRLARTLSDKSSRSRKSSKRGSGSVSVKSAAGIGWEPYTYGSDEAARMRSWEDVRNREDKLGLSALLGRARVMERMLKDGKRVSNPDQLPLDGPSGYVHYPALSATRRPFTPPRRPSLQSIWKTPSTPPSSSHSAIRSNSSKSAHKSPSVKSARSKRLSVKTDRNRDDAFTSLVDDEEALNPPALIVHRSSSPPPVPEKHRRSAYGCCSDIAEEKSPAYVEDKVFDLTPDGPHLHMRKVRVEGDDRGRRKRDCRMSQMSRWARDGKRWRLAIAVGAAIVVLLITGLLAGLLSRRNDSKGETVPGVVPAEGCGTGKVGVSCSIGSECTTPPGGSPVSQSLVNLLPLLSEDLGVSIAPQELSSLLATAGLSPQGSDCGQQAVLIDVGSTLVTAESRTSVAWAQTAVLWQLVRSEDASSALKLRDAINTAPWAQSGVRLASAAALIVPRAQERRLDFQGWQFDFDSQIVTPANAFWTREALPNPFQASLAGTSLQTLDRITSFAKASSAQRSTALSRYWIGPLGQPLESLDGFLTAVRDSPLVLPFNGSSSTDGDDLVNQLTDATLSFPPPTVCLAALDSTRRAELREIEQSAFAVNGTDCSERPVYGSINFLRLRAQNASQALVLNEDTKARVVLRHGASQAGDAREWGTPNAMEHVVLSWLQSMPSTEIAREAITFITNSSSPIAPPPGGSVLLSTPLPQLEIALFGPSLVSTTNFTLSLLSDSSSGLFFGSAQASRLRSWALQSTNGGPPSGVLSPAIVWAGNATSPEGFIEQSTTNTAFDAVFEQAATLIQANKVAGRILGLKEEKVIVDKLRSEGLGSIM